MKKVINDFINNKTKLDKWEWIGVIALVIVLSGVFGWVYEFIFYFFNSGMKTFYYRGGNFLPWINIYATGSLLILFFTKKIRKKPLLIFLASVLITGILEYVSGYFVLKITGCRFWDYNTEILNFLNIDGFVCLRSVGFFGISSLLLIYGMVPFCIYLCKHMDRKKFLILSIGLCSIFLLDEFYNLFASFVNLPKATQIYAKWGYKFMPYHCGK